MKGRLTRNNDALSNSYNLRDQLCRPLAILKRESGDYRT